VFEYLSINVKCFLFTDALPFYRNNNLTSQKKESKTNKQHYQIQRFSHSYSGHTISIEFYRSTGPGQTSQFSVNGLHTVRLRSHVPYARHARTSDGTVNCNMELCSNCVSFYCDTVALVETVYVSVIKAFSVRNL
jgi:hypothetical protein